MAAKEPRNPSNTDIMRYLGAIEEKVDTAIGLATSTNGRVRGLEKWQTEIEAVDRYKKETTVVVNNPTAGSVQVKNSALENPKIQAFIAAMTVLMLALAAFFGRVSG